ncbi:hypothetical protein SXCC_04607 [Gluconacetobacter sp. SXCC-1]|nr:hypothetical protein SXCC_04607 [Gluconacetobacter sp. SXCC-1]
MSGGMNSRGQSLMPGGNLSLSCMAVAGLDPAGPSGPSVRH